MRKAQSRRLQRMERSLARGAACERCGYRPGVDAREEKFIVEENPQGEEPDTSRDLCGTCGRRVFRIVFDDVG